MTSEQIGFIAAIVYLIFLVVMSCIEGRDE